MKEKVCIVKHVEDEGPGLLGDYFLHLGSGTSSCLRFSGATPCPTASIPYRA